MHFHKWIKYNEHRYSTKNTIGLLILSYCKKCGKEKIKYKSMRRDK